MENVFVVVRSGEEDNDISIVDVCATEEIASVIKKNWAKDNHDDDVWVEVWGVETEMPTVLKDISKVNVLTHFKLNHSGAVYTTMVGPDDEKFIVNITEGYIYTIKEINSGVYGFTFYKKDNDEKFKGVEVIEDE